MKQRYFSCDKAQKNQITLLQHNLGFTNVPPVVGQAPCCELWLRLQKVFLFGSVPGNVFCKRACRLLKKTAEDIVLNKIQFKGLDLKQPLFFPSVKCLQLHWIGKGRVGFGTWLASRSRTWAVEISHAGCDLRAFLKTFPCSQQHGSLPDSNGNRHRQAWFLIKTLLILSLCRGISSTLFHSVHLPIWTGLISQPGIPLSFFKITCFTAYVTPNR